MHKHHLSNMFQCIAELDLGADAAASLTTDAMNDIVEEVLAAAEFCVVLKNESVAGREDLSVWERIDNPQNVSPAKLTKLKKLAQKGNRLAVVLTDTDKMLQTLESRGYVRCAEISPGSERFIAGWSAWLEGNFPDVKGALVFAHDWEPIYIFENRR